MRDKITVSAPGKLHLLGEHSVVYGKPAIIAAVDKRCNVRISLRSDKKIIIKKYTSQNDERDEDFIFKKTNQARQQWQAFIKTGDVSTLKKITKNPVDFVFIAIGETLQYYQKKIPSGFDISIRSNISVGSGMGSSAAAAVSIAGAVSLFLGEPLHKEKINEIAFLIEQKKHGLPSGGDNATCCYGCLIWYQKKSHPKDDQPMAEVIIKPFPYQTSKNISKKFFIINTGIPEESTGEMVTQVKIQKSKFKSKFEKIFDEQEELVYQLSLALENGDETLTLRCIKEGEKNLEKLGVVSESTKQLIRRIEKAGGAAKICGSGGRKKASGIVLAFHLDRKVLKDLLQSQKIPFSKIQLGAEGLREE